MKPRVSIILPVRDAEGTLAAAMSSVLEQTYEEFDLWVVVNGSTDRSRELADEFAAADKRVRVMESDAAGGVAGAMIAGVEACEGELIARMDADDVSLPERMEKQVALLDAEPDIGVVSCGVELIEPQGEGMARYVDWVNGLGGPEDVARERFIECPVIQPSVMMRREVLSAAGGYRGETWAEDHDLFLRMLEGGVGFGKVPEVLFSWRDSPGRLTRTHAAYAEDEVWRMKAHHLALLPEVRERGVAISGAGPIGKRLARLLNALGVDVKGFFEVNVRRIGETIGGVQVAGLDDFGTRWREAVLLSAVGVEGGRDKVRGVAVAAGYSEGEDFWCCC